MAGSQRSAARRSAAARPIRFPARTGSETDRRIVLVAATAAGRWLLERGRAARVRVVAGVLDGLPAADVEAIRRATAIIAGRL